MTREPPDDAKDLAARFARIKQLTEQLAAAQADAATQKAEVERLRKDLETARKALEQALN